MAKRKKRAGDAVYFVRRTATHIKTGEKKQSRIGGTFLTYKEAQAKLEEDKEAAIPGIPEYEYDYDIETVPTSLLH